MITKYAPFLLALANLILVPMYWGSVAVKCDIAKATAMSNYIDLIDQQVVTENPVQLKAFQHGRIYAENGHSRIPDFLTEGFPSSLRLDIFAIVFLGNAVLWLVFGLAHDTSQASVNNRG